jgi:antitoxin component of MazEF toxin-antitoxin module
MAREVVKVRKVAGSVVVSIPQTLLAGLQIAEGDRVLVETVAPTRLMITKETATMPNAYRTQLELNVLEARLHALEQDTESKVWQHNNNMELDMRLTDNDIFHLEMLEQNRKRAALRVRIAKKRLELFEIQGVISVQ